MKQIIPADLIDQKNLEKLLALNNQTVVEIIGRYTKLCRPDKITVIDDSPNDIEYIKKRALELGEEKPLATPGHTYHFDGPADQGRDKAVTKVLVRPEIKLSKSINTGEREQCLKEIEELFDGIMAGREMIVSFFCLGPNNSHFSIPALQITDSFYVAHAENILYRPGYQELKKLGKDGHFFHFIHSAGELTTNGASKNTDKKRIYIDLEESRVFSVNTQYAGNSLGLKKLALRLAIKKSHDEGWLCEHMFIMGARPEGKNRITYFTGAFPSACGKTSTAMIPGQTIIGDDIAYLKIGPDGRAYAANVEQGIFGIIEDVNPVDDPLIYKTLTTPREIIFSNVLIKNSQPYWLGMGQELPKNGLTYFGEWQKGDLDDKGEEKLPAHKNARYTIRIKELANADQNLDNPDGMPIDGVIYGGRDYDTSPPVVESLSWPHGVFIGAILESETTATIVGKIGEKTHNPMANIDFMVVPLGIYIKNHLVFGQKLDKQPKIFATNYFLKENGKFLNKKIDKKVWLYWMEGRIHGEFKAIETPIGYMPLYQDLKKLFKKIFNQNYSRQDYEKQFALRVANLIARQERIETIYSQENDVPEEFLEHLRQQKERLKKAREHYGKNIVSPFAFI